MVGQITRCAAAAACPDLEVAAAGGQVSKEARRPQDGRPAHQQRKKDRGMLLWRQPAVLLKGCMHQMPLLMVLLLH